MSDSEEYRQASAEIAAIHQGAVDRFVRHQVKRVAPYGREYPEGENRPNIAPDKDRDTRLIIPEKIVDQKIGSPKTTFEKIAEEEPPVQPMGQDEPTGELPRIE